MNGLLFVEVYVVSRYICPAFCCCWNWEVDLPNNL